ncbi:isotrichodermin C-15 hydroxylase [Lasiosphaeris hirsuta]|uniref:Isotrichodermin C-15 hydroxylase n=1 Tax=Lasiosphaeris hirsuta TaxID=260670 RepID=A0AA40E8K8_9PEZI|nr:isotrichodermin C-15 hydroxylase [Lasiosphaeris hirsuta]
MPAIQDVFEVGTSKVTMLLSIAAGSALLYTVASIFYNLFLHPLRHVPGPLLSRATSLPYTMRHAGGTQAFATQKMHDKYGPVVRIAPSHLAFTDVRAWKDIYGHIVGHKSGQPEMGKASVFSRPLDDIPTSILSADREEHSRIRRALSHGFSDASMRAQEPMVAKHVDLLLKRLAQECDGGNKALNSEAWYNWTTFDIAGDLIFGKSFGCLEGSDYHPWILFIFGTVKWGSSMVVLSYLGFHWLVQLIFRHAGQLKIKKMQEYNFAMVRSRLAMKEGREDLFEGIVKHKVDWNLSFEKLSANAFILVLAGSETTATTLSGVTYLLLSHPEALEKLKREVRSAFKSTDEININSVGKLTYMLAVLNEALRMYPPVSSGLVRQVPEGGAQVAGQYVPGGTYVEVQHWSINHSKDNWTDPWTFNPERFINHEGKPEAHNVLEALQAFSVGPRNCIGRNLAYAEMRLILARIVFDFDMRLADDSRNWLERQKAYTLWDRVPLNVYFTPAKRG